MITGMGPIIAARFRNHAHTLVSNDAGKRFMMAYLQVVNEEQPPHQYHQSSKPEAVSDGKSTSMPVSLRDYWVAHCDVCPNNGRPDFLGVAIPLGDSHLYAMGHLGYHQYFRKQRHIMSPLFRLSYLRFFFKNDILKLPI